MSLDKSSTRIAPAENKLCNRELDRSIRVLRFESRSYVGDCRSSGRISL
jgi:hypothetical protein